MKKPKRQYTDFNASLISTAIMANAIVMTTNIMERKSYTV